MRTHFLVLGSSREGAELTLGAPAAPAVAAALRFGDQVAVGGGHLAHGLQYFGEAESLASVWTERVGMRGQDLSQCQGITEQPVQPVPVPARRVEWFG